MCECRAECRKVNYTKGIEMTSKFSSMSVESPSNPQQISLFAVDYLNFPQT